MVFGVEQPDTLTTVYCFAHLYASRRRHDESILFYERACGGYDATFGKDHPTIRSYHQHYVQVLLSQKQDR